MLPLGFTPAETKFPWTPLSWNWSALELFDLQLSPSSQREDSLWFENVKWLIDVQLRWIYLVWVCLRSTFPWPHMTTHNAVRPLLHSGREAPPPDQLHHSFYCIHSFVASNDVDNCIAPPCIPPPCLLDFVLRCCRPELSEGENEQSTSLCALMEHL